MKKSKILASCGTLAFAGTFLALTACGSDSSSGAKVPSGNVFDSYENLPECSEDLGFDVAYVGPDSLIYVCEDGEWIPNFEESSSSAEVYSSSSFGKYDNPAISYGTLTDARDNQTYKTVVIGTQTWMAENLNYKSPTIQGSEVAPATGYEYFGSYYMWDDAQTVCPEGWHLPDTTEWNVLEAFVADSLFGGEKDSVGYALKSTAGWDSFKGESGNGSDAFGFGAVPSGYLRENDSLFLGASKFAYFATTIESDSINTEAYFRSVAYYDDELDLYLSPKATNGRSVRCLKD